MNLEKTQPQSPLADLEESSSQRPRRGRAGRMASGQRFGNLVVIGRAPSEGKWAHSRVYTKCDCGNMRDFRLDAIKRGAHTHCGCRTSQNYSAARKIHGQYCGGIGSKLANTHGAMLERCYNSKCQFYDRYGGRGITVCDRWRVGENGKRHLECFIEDMGYPPSKAYSLDRINNDGNYEPSNCRWATRVEQQNNRRGNVRVEFLGRTQTLTQWTRELNLDYDLVRDRIQAMGWSVERAFTTERRAYRS